MLCRVADSQYWTARYMERAENTARMLEVYLEITLELKNHDPENIERHWEPILMSAGDKDLFYTLYDKIDNYTVPHFLAFNEKNPSSILSCVRSARENARQIRDQINAPMWETINRLYILISSEAVRRMWDLEPLAFCNEIKEYSHLFHGLTAATFPRLDGYSFLQIGKYIERAEKTALILDIKHYLELPKGEVKGGSLDIAHWIAVLKACSALEPYHQVYVTDVLPENIVEFLVLSGSFPRSIHFCLEQLDVSMHSISGCSRTYYSSEAERICGRLLGDLNFKTNEEIMAQGLHEYLERVREDLYTIALELNKLYMFFPVVDPAEEAGQKQSQGADTEVG